MMIDSQQLKASHILDASITAVGFIPGWGWAIGAAYLGADIITKGITGESIGEHLDNAVEKNFNKKMEHYSAFKNEKNRRKYF